VSKKKKNGSKMALDEQFFVHLKPGFCMTYSFKYP